MDEPCYFLRVRGVVSGPFDLRQLQAMRRLERLARFHEVSTDRKTWVAASTIAALFPAPAPGSGQGAWRRPAPSGPERAAESTPPPATEPVPAPTAWFYANGQQSVGPISLDELQRLIARGELGQENLVWTDGMTTWLPYCDVAASVLLSPTLPAVAGPPDYFTLKPRDDLS